MQLKQMRCNNMILEICHRVLGLSFFVLFSSVTLSAPSYAKTIDYKFSVNEQKINISGKEATGLSINGSMPGPTVKAKVGDTLRIYVTNNLDTETSIHWHGILLPNRMDGVPYITTPPIMPHETFTYEFPVKHSGTYWYHAHSGLQEQQGVYGSIIFYPSHEEKDYDEEHVIVLSDWTDENPDQVLANIKKDPDYYALKKNAVQSWLKVLENGFNAVKIRINNSWTRMGPMDMSDIGYDAFLINGKKSSVLTHAKPGTRIKLRIINAAASSYFIFEYSGGPMKVIESDGVKVDPFTAQKIRIAMAETYDIIVTIPEDKTYEFRASAEDGTGYAVAHIGHGDLVPAPTYPKPNLVLMDMGGMDHSGMGGHDMSNMKMPMSENNTDHSAMDMSNMPGMDHSAHQAMKMPAPEKNKNMQILKPSAVDKKMDGMEGMDHASMKDMPSMSVSSRSGMKMDVTSSKQHTSLPHVEYLNNYKYIKSPAVTTLPKNNPTRTVALRLTGSMERYVWAINDTPMYAADNIVIKKGENVKFVLINETMMNHPIHIHGHFFRVLNGQGDYSPLKHTINVAPFETVEIEFEANEEKDWIFHCHNLYHMKLGMGGVIHYDGTVRDADLIHHLGDHSAKHGNTWFNATEIEGFSNFATLNTKFMRHNDYIMIDARHNYKRDYEAEIIYQKYVSQFLGLYIGGDFKREDGEKLKRGIVGLEYTLPFLVKADLRLNTQGKFRFGLGNEHQLTDRMSFDWRWNTDKEYILGMSYAITKPGVLHENLVI